MIKICTVCFREVETNARNFKYCEECRKSSYRIQQQRYRNAHREERREYLKKYRAEKKRQKEVAAMRNKFLAWREQNRLQKKVC